MSVDVTIAGIDTDIDVDELTDEIAKEEIGQTGLRRPAGYLQEDYQYNMRGRYAAETYTRMGNDETCGAVLFAINQLIGQVKWDVESYSDDPEDVRKAEFVLECLEDMEESWSHVVSEILSMLQYGWAYHEIVYKVRGGPQSLDPKFYSKYNDGLIGWRKWPLRGQDSLQRWVYESNDVDQLLGMVQIPAPSYQQKFIPFNKALLFRPKAHKDSPEGTSILRSAYNAWYYKENLQKIEAIGAERDLAGIPVMKMPPAYFSKTRTPDQTALYNLAQNIVRNLRRDEQSGLVLPAMYDENGNDAFKLELLSSGGTRQVNTNEIINRYDQRIAMSVLADFMLLGQQSVGSFALADNKTNLFTVAIGGWLKSIANVINRIEMPRLFKLNGWDVTRLPALNYGDIETQDLDKMAQFITSMTSAGMPLFPDEVLEDHLREMAGLPIRSSIGDDLGDDPVDEQRGELNDTGDDDNGEEAE